MISEFIVHGLGYHIVEIFDSKKVWQIEVHLQFNLVFNVFKYQLMDMHNHALNGACSIQWKTQALQHRRPSVLQQIGLVLQV